MIAFMTDVTFHHITKKKNSAHDSFGSQTLSLEEDLKRQELIYFFY